MSIKNILVIALIGVFGLYLGALIGKAISKSQIADHYYNNACWVDTQN